MSALPHSATKVRPIYTMVIELRALPSGGAAVLSCTGHGASVVEHLIAMEMCSAPIDEDVLSEFETGVFTALESAVGRMLGIQSPLGLVL